MSDAARFRRMAAEWCLTSPEASSLQRQAADLWVERGTTANLGWPRADALSALLARVDREARAEERKRCALIADAVSMGRPDNRQALVPRTAYRAGACKVAWRIRQGDIADAAAEQRDTGGADTEAGEHREGGDHG